MGHYFEHWESITAIKNGRSVGMGLVADVHSECYYLATARHVIQAGLKAHST